MRKTIIAWSACAAALLPALAATTASADGVPSQDIGQLATSQQKASSSGTSTQVNPSNNAIHVSILSPGSSGGTVSQTNSSAATSAAGNTNGSSQTAQQAGGGGGGTQAIGQAADNHQNASSNATSTQDHPSNTAISVAILSPGANSGDVRQSNNSAATSAAGNTNGSSQTAQQAGGGGGSGGTQAIGQAADNHQNASSNATSTQDHPSNTAISVAILSPGAKGGSVDQSNSSSGNSKAGNTNGTSQNAQQAARSRDNGCYDRCNRDEPCGNGSCHSSLPGVQAIGQLASNDQQATSDATSEQTGASNVAGGLDVLGLPYRHEREVRDAAPQAVAGGVSQSNSSSAGSAAGNTNGTSQRAEQVQDHGGVQAIGQAALNSQNADSTATSKQWCPSNVALGGFGWVRQDNSSAANSAAGNTNGTTQRAGQVLGSLVPVVI